MRSKRSTFRLVCVVFTSLLAGFLAWPVLAGAPPPKLLSSGLSPPPLAVDPERFDRPGESLCCLRSSSRSLSRSSSDDPRLDPRPDRRRQSSKARLPRTCGKRNDNDRDEDRDDDKNDEDRDEDRDEDGRWTN